MTTFNSSIDDMPVSLITFCLSLIDSGDHIFFCKKEIDKEVTHILPYLIIANLKQERMCLFYTLRPRQNGCIFQTTISNAFSLLRMYKFPLIFHWSLLSKVQLTIFQHWFRWWLGAVQATSHYLNQCCHKLPTHICVTRPQLVKKEMHKNITTLFMGWHSWLEMIENFWNSK